MSLQVASISYLPSGLGRWHEACFGLLRRGGNFRHQTLDERNPIQCLVDFAGRKFSALRAGLFAVEEFPALSRVERVPHLTESIDSAL